MKTLKFKDWICQIEIGQYFNGRIAISLIGAKGTEYYGEPIATATTCLPEIELEEGYLHIKEWSENKGMTEALIKAGIIENQFQTREINQYGDFVVVAKIKNL